MNTNTQIRLGIDVGGVIIDRVSDGADTSFFGTRYLETPAVADSFGTIAALAKGRFAGNVWIVSKCGANTERKTREWLAHNGFHDQTGIPPENVRFCRNRPDKAPICAELGLTHFVDDRLEVLSYLVTVPHRFLFRPDEDEVAKNHASLAGVTRVDSWADVASRMTHSP